MTRFLIAETARMLDEDDWESERAVIEERGRRCRASSIIDDNANILSHPKADDQAAVPMQAGQLLICRSMSDVFDNITAACVILGDDFLTDELAKPDMRRQPVVIADTASLAGLQPVRLLQPLAGGASAAAVAPSGDRVALVEFCPFGPAGQMLLWQYDLLSGQSHALGFLPSDMTIHGALSYSPDGRWLLASGGGIMQVYLIHPETQQLLPLSYLSDSSSGQEQLRVCGACWFPQAGASVVLLTTPTATGCRLLTLDLETPSMQPLVDLRSPYGGPWRLKSLDVSSDGRYVLALGNVQQAAGWEEAFVPLTIIIDLVDLQVHLPFAWHFGNSKGLRQHERPRWLQEPIGGSPVVFSDQLTPYLQPLINPTLPSAQLEYAWKELVGAAALALGREILDPSGGLLPWAIGYIEAADKLNQDTAGASHWVAANVYALAADQALGNGDGEAVHHRAKALAHYEWAVRGGCKAAVEYGAKFRQTHNSSFDLGGGKESRTGRASRWWSR